MNFENLSEVVVFDVETTGLSPKNDRIVSIALLKVDLQKFELDNGQLKGSYEGLTFVFNPQIPIPRAATEIHGITDKDVKNEPEFADKAREIREFIGSLPIIAHNVKVDSAFLDAELIRTNVTPLRNNIKLCTMFETHARACEIHGRDVKWPKLTEAGVYCGVTHSQSQTHDALEDAIGALTLVLGLRSTEIKNGKVTTKRRRRGLMRWLGL
ncbi:3'-5' exonuclease [Lentibacter sp. XHP0401]|uniref:3'-5' exonuclease n=1 Tax=Lentibacter sp. XHP0401 TaxID=2984334 RepID=UPI0021E7A388|nr:3'-5' exonuclease [Lentibacter sp. XHP0401]MCV2893309.1 3'-5' exonuclease [Lentibacter sp. XHP0401]